LKIVDLLIEQGHCDILLYQLSNIYFSENKDFNHFLRGSTLDRIIVVRLVGKVITPRNVSSVVISISLDNVGLTKFPSALPLQSFFIAKLQYINLPSTEYTAIANVLLATAACNISSFQLSIIGFLYLSYKNSKTIN
jgi:hypothetical protein